MSAPLPPWATTRQGGPPAADSPLDRQYAAFIGPRWTTYRRKFAPFFDDPRFQPTWNWSAGLFTPVWFLYRKLYLPFVFFWVIPGVVFRMLWDGDPPTMRAIGASGGAPSPAMTDAALVLFGVQLSAMLLAGGSANYLLFRRAKAAIRLAQQGAFDAPTLLTRLERFGSVNRTGVFVVIAVVLFGAVAAMNGAGGAAR